MQLLRIESIPIQYTIQAERPRLEIKQADNADIRVDRRAARLDIRSRNTQIRLDTTAMRQSMGLRSVNALLSDQAAQGMQAAVEATAEMSRFGTQVGQIQNGVTIAQLVTQKIMAQPDTVTAFIPSVGPDISWVPGGVDLQYRAGELSTDWEINKNVLDYIPGKFKFIIEQYPDIKIEYLGEPRYVPPSASPGYEDRSA